MTHQLMVKCNPHAVLVGARVHAESQGNIKKAISGLRVAMAVTENCDMLCPSASG